MRLPNHGLNLKLNSTYTTLDKQEPTTRTKDEDTHIIHIRLFKHKEGLKGK